MVERRATETYYLVVIGLIIGICGLASAVAAVGLRRTVDLVTGHLGGPDGPLGLLVAAGLMIVTWGLTRLYRRIERRGLIHPPGT